MRSCSDTSTDFSMMIMCLATFLAFYISRNIELFLHYWWREHQLWYNFFMVIKYELCTFLFLMKAILVGWWINFFFFFPAQVILELNSLSWLQTQGNPAAIDFWILRCLDMSHKNSSVEFNNIISLCSQRQPWTLAPFTLSFWVLGLGVYFLTLGLAFILFYWSVCIVVLCCVALFCFH